MIQSMTGFGKTVISLPAKKVTVEIKSLNSKNFDLHTYIPPEYREKELPLRKLVSDKVGRGKVNFSLYVENTGEETSTEINHSVIRHYMESLKTIPKNDTDDELELLKIAIKLPDALTTKTGEVNKQEFSMIEAGIKETLDKLNQYRSDEGKALENDFRLRLKNLSDLLSKVIAIDAERIENTRERLRKSITDLKENIDQNRFEQELVYYIEKYDITEEKTRLQNHLSYFAECLDSPESNGKKLNFIGQEIGREINTIGSKSNHAPMQKLVVQMKDELEKIKEQVLNVL